MNLLKLEVDDAEVWALTLQAAESSGGMKPLTVRCVKHCALVRLGATQRGPLFTSSWEVEPPVAPVFTNGSGELSPSAARKLIDKISPVTERSGPPMRQALRDGVVALLAVPADLPQLFPDLLVRCRHGDAVLDRAEVLHWIRRGKVSGKVQTTLPRRGYASPRQQGSRKSRAREERRIGVGNPVSIEEMNRRLGWDTFTGDTPEA